MVLTRLKTNRDSYKREVEVCLGFYPAGASPLEALFTSIITVALAEIGDKTQLLALLLTARFSHKTAIVAGILVATLLNHAASAWLGVWLGNFVISFSGQLLLALSFIAMAMWLLIPDKEDDEAIKYGQYGAFLVTTSLFFFAEIGDKTQIATIALAANYHSVLWVTAGTTVGMLLANVPVVYMGDAIMKRIPLHLARWLASAVFLVIGLTIIPWAALFE